MKPRTVVGTVFDHSGASLSTSVESDVQIVNSQIQILPADVASTVAAGEVVLRPASVVKELVENAIDAKASRIDIAIENGGKDRIRVSDNGDGILPSDLKKAFAKHGTSKIEKIDDLFRLRSLGFRGEGLHSIAAVSSVTVRSKTRCNDLGYEILCSHGKLGDLLVSASTGGTVVDVGDLFEHIPARKKFLKSSATEYGHIISTIRYLATAYPKCAFYVTHNNRQTLALSSHSSRAERFGAIFLPKHLSMLQKPGDVCRVSTSSTSQFFAGLSGKQGSQTGGESRVNMDLIWLAKDRPHAAGQSFFQIVNQRPIKDRVLTRLMNLFFEKHSETSATTFVKPTYAVLNLSIDPSLIDVNIHPQKTEIRFQNLRVIEETMETLLHTALANQASVLSAAVDRVNDAGNPYDVAEASIEDTTQADTDKKLLSVVHRSQYSKQLDEEASKRFWLKERASPSYHGKARSSIEGKDIEAGEPLETGVELITLGSCPNEKGTWAAVRYRPFRNGLDNLLWVDIDHLLLDLISKQFDESVRQAINKKKSAENAMSKAAIGDDFVASAGTRIENPMLVSIASAISEDVLSSKVDQCNLSDLGFVTELFGEATFLVKSVPDFLLLGMKFSKHKNYRQRFSFLADIATKLATSQSVIGRAKQVDTIADVPRDVLDGIKNDYCAGLLGVLKYEPMLAFLTASTHCMSEQWFESLPCLESKTVRKSGALVLGCLS